jgi:hypothetical protein
MDVDAGEGPMTSSTRSARRSQARARVRAPRASGRGSWLRSLKGVGQREAHTLPCRLGEPGSSSYAVGRESGTAECGPVPEMRWRYLTMDQVPDSYLSESSTFTR